MFIGIERYVIPSLPSSEGMRDVFNVLSLGKELSSLFSTRANEFPQPADVYIVTQGPRTCQDPNSSILSKTRLRYACASALGSEVQVTFSLYKSRLILRTSHLI